MPCQRLIVTAAVVLAINGPVGARSTWLVDDNAPLDPGPGDATVSDPAEDGTPAHPFDAIQEAIDAGRDGDEIVVADGVYCGRGNRDLDFGGRLLTVRSESGDPRQCIIDAEGGARFLFQSGETADAVVRDLTISGGVAEFGAGVACLSGSGPTIDGCRIVGGLADVGAGLLAFGGSSPTLVDCAIEDNLALDAGGGIYLEQDSPAVLVRCTIARNRGASGTFGGGGLFVYESPLGLVSACVFHDNETGGDAGGLACLQTPSGLIVGCTFADNSASDTGGGLTTAFSEITIRGCDFDRNAAADGGAMVLFDSVVIVDDCVFTDNEAAGDGGAILLSTAGDVQVIGGLFVGNGAGLAPFSLGGGGGVAFIEAAHGELRDCVFLANGAVRGGGVAAYSSQPVVRGCRFAANGSTANGGAISFYSDGAVIDCDLVANESQDGGGLYGRGGADALVQCVNSRFLGNRASGPNSDRGGAAFVWNGTMSFTGSLFSGNTSAGSGGAILVQVGADCELTSCTLVGNDATQADGGGGVLSAGDLDARNCIFWNNTEAGVSGASTQVRSDGGSDVVWRSIIEGGWTGAGGDNLDADPALVDADGPDDQPGTDDDDLRLLAGSPAIDAADTNALPADPWDLDGDGDLGETHPVDAQTAPRLVDDPAAPDSGAGRPMFLDIGALERQLACPGDLDGSGAVDVDDLRLLITGWPGADVDGDGVAGVSDLVILLARWGAYPAPPPVR